MRHVILFCIAICLSTVSAAGQISFKEKEQANHIFARKSVGEWQGTAFYYNPLRRPSWSTRFECIVRTDGAALSMRREVESREMPMDWKFLEEDENNGCCNSFALTNLSIDSTKYEMSRRPWRIAEPAGEGGIVLSFGISLPVFRKNKNSPWLPTHLLTSEMLSARTLTLEYQYETETGIDDTGESIWGTVKRRKRINLSGFSEVTKWCTVRLIQDKLDLQEKLAKEDEEEKENPPRQTQAPQRYLILEFPDGVRGGRGRIQGMAEPPTTQDTLEFLQSIEACGAKDLFIQNNVSHRVLVYVPSTRRDRRIVECLKQSTAYHFNADRQESLVMQLDLMASPSRSPDHSSAFKNLEEGAIEH